MNRKTNCSRNPRPRLTAEQHAERCREALTRAISSQSMMNWEPVIEEFTARGIPAEEITPKVNVFTFDAWRALGRHVRKGEKAVSITTWIPIKRKEEEEEGKGPRPGEICLNPPRKIPHTAYVFHISQTDPDDDQETALQALAAAHGITTDATGAPVPTNAEPVTASA